MIFIILFTYSMVSCQKTEQGAPIGEKTIYEEVLPDNTSQTELNIVEEKPFKRPFEQGSYSIINGSIYYIPSEEEKKRFEEARNAARENKVLEQAEEARQVFYDFRDPKNIQKDFSAYDIHPLEKLVGKWWYLDYYLNKHDRGSYIEIYKSNTEYKYTYDHGGSIETGLVHLMTNKEKVFWRYKNSEYTVSCSIVGDLTKIHNSYAFFLDDEGPIGHFLLETEPDPDGYAKTVDNVNGSWIGQYELIDGTPIEKKQYSWGRGFSMPGTSTEFDLGHKIIIMPGFGVYGIESVFKDEEGSICLQTISYNNETDEDPINIKITFLDYNKAYITHDKWELLDDKRYSPEEKWPWNRLSGPEGE